MTLLWPVAGTPEEYPVYRGEQGHINDGQGPAWDMANQEGLAWIAVEDGKIVGAGYDPAQAGNVVVLESSDGLRRWHYCHGQALEVTVGQQLSQGHVIGHVGHTGWTIPAGPSGAHLHLWAEEWLGDWARRWPSDIYAEDEMSELEELKQRVDALEAALAAVVQPGTANIVTQGNITLEDAGRDPSDPVKLFLGKLAEHGLYFFWQNRPPGQGTDVWGGFETWTAPPDGDPAHASWGYGALPGRAWFQGWCLEADSSETIRNIVAERIYLAPPLYRNLQTGGFELPDHYSAQGVPFTALGEMMGGIQPDREHLNVYITRDGDDVVLINGTNRTIIG